MKSPLEPFRIKVIEPINCPTPGEREKYLREAGFNLFKIPAEAIFIDLLTDSGTSAMSHHQWAGLMKGDESYAGCRNFYRLKEVIYQNFGFEYVLPTHQGRAAEHIFFNTLLKEGDIVPNNIHFDTTRANIEFLNCRAVNCVIDEGLDPQNKYPFKGNMDPNKLSDIIEKNGVNRIPVVLMTITNNSGGGQPVSMANIREISDLCHQHQLLFFFDAARFAENAYFIKIREKGFSDRSIEEIVLKMFSYVDGFILSAKKDALVNIGGLIVLRNKELFQQLQNLLILHEGFPTYGGLAGRDLEAMAIGLKEALQEKYLEYRLAQTAFLGNLLTQGGIPVVQPVGGHAVYIDAKKFIQYIPQSQFPGQALCIALYRYSGIRSVEIGSLMFAQKDHESGEWNYPKLELVRLAIPRRVYTASHLEYVAESVLNIKKSQRMLKGLRIVYEPSYLRHFTAVLEEINY
jgi:tyrosine phenol-lyase